MTTLDTTVDSIANGILNNQSMEATRIAMSSVWPWEEQPQTYHAGWRTDIHRLNPGSSPVAGPFCLLPDPALPAWQPQPYSPTASELEAGEWLQAHDVTRPRKVRNHREARKQLSAKHFRALRAAA